MPARRAWPMYFLASPSNDGNRRVSIGWRVALSGFPSLCAGKHGKRLQAQNLGSRYASLSAHEGVSVKKSLPHTRLWSSDAEHVGPTIEHIISVSWVAAWRIDQRMQRLRSNARGACAPWVSCGVFQGSIIALWARRVVVGVFTYRRVLDGGSGSSVSAHAAGVMVPAIPTRPRARLSVCRRG